MKYIIAWARKQRIVRGQVQVRTQNGKQHTTWFSYPEACKQTRETLEVFFFLFFFLNVLWESKRRKNLGLTQDGKSNKRCDAWSLNSQRDLFKGKLGISSTPKLRIANTMVCLKTGYKVEKRNLLRIYNYKLSHKGACS